MAGAHLLVAQSWFRPMEQALVVRLADSGTRPRGHSRPAARRSFECASRQRTRAAAALAPSSPNRGGAKRGSTEPCKASWCLVALGSRNGARIAHKPQECASSTIVFARKQTLHADFGRRMQRLDVLGNGAAIASADFAGAPAKRVQRLRAGGSLTARTAGNVDAPVAGCHALTADFLDIATCELVANRRRHLRSARCAEKATRNRRRVDSCINGSPDVVGMQRTDPFEQFVLTVACLTM